MKLNHLVRKISDLSNDELIERLREIRHRRETVRPAAARRVAQEEKKEKKATTSKAAKSLEKLLDGMSPEDRDALLKQLSGEVS